MKCCLKEIKYIFLLFGIFTCSSFSSKNNTSSIQIENLRCEYLVDPLGIDIVNPRFSWEMISSESAKKQKAYEILVASDSLVFSRGIGDMWNSGKVNSVESNQIAYQGKPLISDKSYFWKVRVWDENGNVSEWSSISYWSMGLLHPSDWKAKWIGLPSILPAVEQDKHIVPPSPLLRKEFKVNKKIRRATLFSTSLGIYNIYLNGKKVGDHILAPEWTDYFKRVQYQTYDVTALLNDQMNVIGAILADGWYAGTMFNHPDRGNYGFDRRLLAQLEIIYTDGSSDRICSDSSWKILKGGPVREVSIFDGEIFDENLNPTNWMQPGFNDDCWTPVTVDTSISLSLNAQMNEPIKVIRELKPVNVFQSKKETYIFDMGQNMVGWSKLSLPYNPGKKIILRYGEMLNPDSTLYTENLRIAKQTDIYIPGKSDSLHFEPKFTYHGFRYVEITGLTKKPELDDVVGEVIASGAPVASSMQTSDKELNKLWGNILWTQLGNMYGVPTDCPQRDERAGWMGDAQVFCETAMYYMDMSAFYTKWFRDIRDAQTENGRFPNYAPQVGMRYYDAPGWADAGVIIPWKFYETYGDKRTLSTQYGAMCKFIDFVYDKNPKLIRVNAVGDNYGDWLNGNTIKANDYPKEGGAVSKDIFNTAYFAYSTELVAKASKVLGRNVQFRHYDSLAKAIRKAFVIQFMDKNGVIKGNTQAGYGMALAFGLVPEKLKAAVANHMLDAVVAYDYRLSTGIHSTARLMNELSKYGYTDIAYRLLQSHRFPSWFYSIDQGATTIWERWDGYVKGRGFQDPGMNSFNHYAIGSVGEWLYKHILGINPDEENPGYHHFIIQPQPGGSLKWAKGAYHSIAGDIVVSWKKEDRSFTLYLEIPVNTTATVIMPPGKLIQENGIPVGKIKNIKELRTVKIGSKLLVPSGHYSFLVTD